MKDDSWDDDDLVELLYTPPRGWEVVLPQTVDADLHIPAPLPPPPPRNRAARREERKKKRK